MLKQLSLPADAQAMADEQARSESEARAIAARDLAQRTFQALHGIYGNVFFSRYQTGQANESGEDEGVIGAIRQWAYDLRDFDVETVKEALERAKARYIEYPPTLPQFIELCRAARPRKTSTESKVLLTMGQPITSQYARQARAINERHDQRAKPSRAQSRELPATLDGIKQAIADAVGAAGGDEAAELVRLDRVLMPAAGGSHAA